jgi:DsbC/DsbD-like thiol-disulfide interchange protein
LACNGRAERTLTALVTSAIACSVAVAVAPQPVATGVPTPRVRARLVSERESLVPGRTALLGISFDIDPGWYMYWDGLNDSGMPPAVTLTLPPGFTAGPIRWPVPKRHLAEGEILDHVYEGRVTLVVPMTVPTSAAPGENVQVRASLEWFVCRDVCIRESGQTSLTLRVTAAAPDPPRLTADACLLAGPFPEPELPPWIAASWSGRTLRITADPPNGPPVASLAFYPLADCAPPADLVHQGEAAGPRLSIDFKRTPMAGSRARGLLVVFRTPPPARTTGGPVSLEASQQAYTVDIPVPAGTGS